MTYPGQRKPPDYSAKTAFKTVGLMTAAGLLLVGCVAGVAELAGGQDDEPDVEVTTAAPAGVNRVVPSASATSAVASPSPSPTVSSPAPKATTKKSPAPARTTKAPPPPPEDEPDDVYYANCSEARAAGAAPLYRGEPGYRKGLDRDGDGVACES